MFLQVRILKDLTPELQNGSRHLQANENGVGMELAKGRCTYVPSTGMQMLPAKSSQLDNQAFLEFSGKEECQKIHRENSPEIAQRPGRSPPSAPPRRTYPARLQGEPPPLLLLLLALAPAPPPPAAVAAVRRDPAPPPPTAHGCGSAPGAAAGAARCHRSRGPASRPGAAAALSARPGGVTAWPGLRARLALRPPPQRPPPARRPRRINRQKEKMALDLREEVTLRLSCMAGSQPMGKDSASVPIGSPEGWAGLEAGPQVGRAQSGAHLRPFTPLGGSTESSRESRDVIPGRSLMTPCPSHEVARDHM
ncbi:uncharacterized protein LOC143694755 [Agelaius phoeniceus]|uniref:uncharacterized protein LOC143694755 n=1 Tax=Agelaius phoeniceus TaxID=39638 RepID=UPI004055143F